MPKLTRKNQKIFAGSASNNGQFGSAQLGTKVLSNDLDTIQALSAFLNGWNDATISSEKLPTLEEFQALHYMTTRQLSYLFEQGIPEYNVDTTYFQKSMVIAPGTYELWGSLVNDNVGNSLVEGANWTLLVDFSDMGGGATPPVGSASALSIVRPSVSTVDIDASSIVLKDGVDAYEATSVNLTADITVSGINGLDTGSEANIWYYIWVIYNGTTVASLLSASSTAPTMPSGYTYKALVGAVKNTSGDFVNFKQSGKKYMYVVEPTVASGTFGSGSWTTTDISAFFPSALTDFVYFHGEGSTSDALYITNDGSVSAAFGTSAPNRVIPTANASVRGTFFSAFPILTADTIYLSANGTLYAVGFDITKI